MHTPLEIIQMDLLHILAIYWLYAIYQHSDFIELCINRFLENNSFIMRTGLRETSGEIVSQHRIKTGIVGN